MLGISMQFVGLVLVLIGLLIPRRSRTVRRRCRYIQPTAWATFTHECWPGQNREQLIGVGIVLGGLCLILVGRRLAKRSGLD